MRGAGGLLFLTSWRLGLSLVFWVLIIIFVVSIFRCIKAVILAIKHQGLALLDSYDTRGRDDVYRISATSRPQPPHQGRGIHDNICRISSRPTINQIRHSNHPHTSPTITQQQRLHASTCRTSGQQARAAAADPPPSFDYLPPNTPATDTPEPPPTVAPPPYSAVEDDDGGVTAAGVVLDDRPPPTYESLYPKKDAVDIPPV